MGFYSYLWLRKNGTPYYVGKGTRSRAFKTSGHCISCPDDRSRIIVIPWSSEADAFASEKRLIAMFGRIDLGTGCLRNLTDGGDGHAGYVQSEETKQKRALKLKGRPCSAETKQLISEVKKAKSVKTFLGRSLSESARQKVSKAQKGKPKSAEHRRKLSEASRKWWASQRCFCPVDPSI